MNPTEIITVIALIVGPVLAVLVQIFIQKRTAIRSQRGYVFQTLMAYRADVFNAERLKALSLIDVVFHNVPSVRAEWKEYWESLNDPSVPRVSPVPAAVAERWRRREYAMLAKMAQSLGYGKEITHDVIERAYIPQQSVDSAQNMQKLFTEARRVFEQSENFGASRRERSQ